MSKKITGYIKLQVPAGKAKPEPLISSALQHHEVDVTEFCKVFNEETAQMDSKTKVPVLITVYADGSFTLLTKMRETAGQPTASAKTGKFVSAKTRRTVKSSPVEPQLGTQKIQEVVRSVLRKEERAERASH